MPAKRATIFPQISAEANAMLGQVCESQGCAPGVVVEAALHALLNPREVTDRDAVLVQGQLQLHQDLLALLSFHKKILALLEAQQSPMVQVADFADLYNEETPEKADEEVIGFEPGVGEITQPGGWRKLFPVRRKTI